MKLVLTLYQSDWECNCIQNICFEYSSIDEFLFELELAVENYIKERKIINNKLVSIYDGINITDAYFELTNKLHSINKAKIGNTTFNLSDYIDYTANGKFLKPEVKTLDQWFEDNKAEDNEAE